MAKQNVRTAARCGIGGGIKRCWSSSELAMEDVTLEQIETQILGAKQCASLTLPSRQVRPLLNLAMRKAIKDSGTIARLQRAARGVEVRLTGDEIRMILDFALQTKLAEKPPRPSLRVEPPDKGV
jgi:hypothetical protein